MKKEDMTNDANFHAFISYQKTKKTEEIYLKSFEISEEDLRVKSASFETTKKIDTSKEMTWLYVTFLGQIIYAGNILSSEYDETTGYYKYSTIGHQIWLSSKTWYVANAEAKTEDLYSILKEFLDKTVAETTVAGYVLQPKKKYQSYQSTTNNWELTDGLFYEDKTYYEILMSLIAKTNCAIDFYVDENNLVHADPLDVKAWQSNKSILFTTDKLKEYTIKQDSTNIITSVLVKTTDIYKNNKITEPNVYKGSDLIGIDLTMYYGNLSAFTQFDTTKANTNKIKKGLKDVDSNEALARNQITSGCLLTFAGGAAVSFSLIASLIISDFNKGDNPFGKTSQTGPTIGGLVGVACLAGGIPLWVKGGRKMKAFADDYNQRYGAGKTNLSLGSAPSGLGFTLNF